MDVNGHAYEAAGTRAVAAVTLVLLPAAVLVLGSIVHFFVQRHEAKLDAAEKAKRQRFADFERRAEEKRKDAGRQRGADMVEQYGGHFFGEMTVTDGFARKGKKRRGIIYVREFVCVGIWVSALVHEREAAALQSLVGVSADLEYLETESTLEGALTLLATASADQCINQIVATRLRHGSIMTSTPSTRRQLGGAALSAPDSLVDLCTGADGASGTLLGLYDS
jgi:hypothetical protein